MYLLDTNIISERMKPNPMPALLLRFNKTKPEELSTSTITVGEIYFGAHFSSDPNRFIEALQNILKNLKIFNFDLESAKVYGEVKAALKNKGAPLDEPDLRIASICLSHNLVLVTANTKHFSRIEKLKLENWLND